MTINFKPFDELFTPVYQLTYISMYGGYIDVGPHTYSVFHNYTMVERQQIFQMCKKYLPWQDTLNQEQWERTMYMYQFVIKSPPPFPYLQHQLNKNIIVELISKRNYTTKIFDSGGGTRTAEIHCGHIHYKDAIGDFQNVDFTWVYKTTPVPHWQMKKANYNIYVAENFGANQLIRFDNKFDGANHTIYFEPHSLQWVNKNDPNDRVMIKAAQSVTGVMDNNTHTITYTNAFGSNIDFVVELRRHGFKKYIRFNTKPTLSPPSADYVPVLLHKYEATGLKIRAKDSGTDWNNDSYYDSEEGFILSEAASQYKTRIRRAYIQDSSEYPINRQKLKLYWEKRDGVLWLAKVLPKTFLANATYPVMADASPETFYTGPGDGKVGNHAVGTTWDTIHNAATGSSVDYGSADAEAISFMNSANSAYEIKRCFLPFLTEGLPDNATITATTLSIWFISTSDNDNDAQAYVTIVQTDQPDPTQLTTADYNNCGATDNPTEGIDNGERKDITNISTGQYTVFTYNATGMGWINKGAGQYSLFGIREGHDVEDNLIVIVGAGSSGVTFRTSEQADVTNDPKLIVTYTVPGMSGAMTTNTGYWGW